MEHPIHRLGELFQQLGLPDEPAAVEAFLAEHRHHPSHIALAELPFWTPSQTAFLREELAKDGDWAELIDVFGVLLGR